MALDPQILALAKAIRQHETGNRPIAGATGELASRYQYLPSTWRATAAKYLGNPDAELTEENQRLVKLILPPTSNKKWNPNSFTVLPELEAYYMSIHTPKTLNSLVFDSTLTVEQEDFFSMVDYRRKYEVYAKNVGLVKKVFKDLIIAGFDKTNVQKGKELEFTCIDFGVE
jgi:hypothetical protein